MLDTNSSSQDNMADQELFSRDLICPEVSAALPEGYVIRPLRRGDYKTGFLDCLRILTTVGNISEDQFNERWDWMAAQNGTYFVLVIEDTATSRVIATGALLLERKFIHSLGSAGHIEDIAVDRDQQGKKLGLRIITALDYLSQKLGCYKTILDCSEANEGFYVKCGYKRAGRQMAHYYNKST